MQPMIVCGCHVALHGMGTFVHAIDRDGQHDQDEESGKKFQVDKFTHKCFWIMFDAFQAVKIQYEMQGCISSGAE